MRENNFAQDPSWP